MLGILWTLFDFMFPMRLLLLLSWSIVQLFVTPWIAAHQSYLSFTISQDAQTHVYWVGDTIQSPHPMSFSSPAFNLSNIRVLSNESAFHIWWPKYWSFSFSISTYNEYSRLISFKIDYFDPLDVQGALKNLHQPHSLKTSVLWSSALFMVQLSHLYMATGKTTAVTRHTSVSKIMSLLLNILSRFAIVFLPRSKHFSIPWLQSLSAVILDPKKIKSVTISFFFFSHLFAMKWWNWMP